MIDSATRYWRQKNGRPNRLNSFTLQKTQRNGTKSPTDLSAIHANILIDYSNSGKDHCGNLGWF